MSKYDLLNELYKAVDAYCTESKAAKAPIPEHYWRDVEWPGKQLKNTLSRENLRIRLCGTQNKI